MPRSDIDVVRDVLGTAFDGRLADVYDSLSPDFIVKTSSGHFYLGHDGFTLWVQHTSAAFSHREFELAEIRELGHGFVLIAGSVRRRLTRGGEEIQPGAWLIHVRDECVTAVLFFRTVDEALAALPPGVLSDPVRVVEKIVDAMNRRDPVAILALLSPDIDFELSTEEGAPRSGIAEVAEALAAIGADYDEYVAESSATHDLGDGYVVLETVIRAERAGATERSKRIWLVHIEDGLLRESTFHTSVADAMAAARAVQSDQ